VNVGLGVEREWEGFIKALAETVKELRFMLGLSQNDLANRAMTSQGTISRIESGNHPDLPFITVMKVLLTLSSDTRLILDALSPHTSALLIFAGMFRPFAAGLQASPPDPVLANLLLAFQSLNQTQRRAFVRLVTPIATYMVEVSNGTAVVTNDG
jgi:transcriptional regulator with XRE-family HTH domain